MDLYGFLTFCTVYVLAVATPGPGVAAVIARSLARGAEGAVPFIAGFLVGDLVWFTIAATGLTALAQSASTVFVVIKYVGAIYLAWLAWRLWTGPVRPLETNATPGAGQSGFRIFLGSLTLTLGNPKTILFFLALLPTVVDLRSLGPLAFLEIAGVIALMLPLVLGLYVLVGARARSLFRSPRALRNLNRGAGTAMAGAALAVAAR